MNIYAIFSYPTNGRDFDQEEACKALIPGEKYQLQNAFVGRSVAAGHYRVLQLGDVRFRGWQRETC